MTQADADCPLPVFPFQLMASNILLSLALEEHADPVDT